MMIDRGDSSFVLMGEDVLSIIVDFLPVRDVFQTLSLVCHRFGKLLLRESRYISQFAYRLVGLSKVPLSHLKYVRRELVLTEKIGEKRLLFEGQWNPCYLNQVRYQAENMFDYSPSVYIANTHAGNIVARAFFSGLYDERNKFKEDIHEDVVWFTQFEAPSKYRSAWLLDDHFLSDKPVRHVSDVFQSNEFNTKADLWSLMTTNAGQTGLHQPSKPAIISRVGVGRPVFTTHPVRTLLISTRAQSSDVMSLKPFYGLDSLERVKKCDSVKIGSMQTLADYTSVEFEGTEGPLLWVQFTDSLSLQADITLRLRRRATQLEVLLIDSEDRKAEFGGENKGIAINYVVAAGWVGDVLSDV